MVIISRDNEVLRGEAKQEIKSEKWSKTEKHKHGYCEASA